MGRESFTFHLIFSNSVSFFLQLNIMTNILGQKMSCACLSYGFWSHQQTDGMFKLQYFEERLMKGLFTKCRKHRCHLGKPEKMTLYLGLVTRVWVHYPLPTLGPKGLGKEACC